ncbi:MAG: 3-oxoacyl-ACP reductase [Caldithrix sp. RBG_13_44_9]|nr:MAG: 3-oxoacyl-ACP reductase [Caldithrix sp. RBG_13_44_9]
MDLGLKDKAVLVMASSDGIGKGVAVEFAKEGANVMLFARGEEKLKEVQREIKSLTKKTVLYVVGDITQPEDIKKVVSKTLTELGPIYALINNTGGPPAGTFDKFRDNDWQSAFELTLLSFIRTIQAVLPSMKENGGGRIVNITSSSVKVILDNLILSNTFRMGIVGLTKTLASELGKDNILINVLGPGKIMTERVEYLDSIRAEKASVSKDEYQKKAMQTIPLGRYGTPEEFAKLTVFLCSQANTYITGQTLVVDGGMVKAY